jgi:F-type H+-transporting ATPase subunit b
MLIDWFTLGVQVLNFVILVMLMKHFLYQPILNSIDIREKLIAATLSDADKKHRAAVKERDVFRHKIEEIDQQRDSLFNQATNEVKAEGDRLLTEANKTADAVSAKRQEMLKVDVKNLNKAIEIKTQQEVFAISRLVLSDLASTTLEERMCDLFTQRLQAMEEKEKKLFTAAFKDTSKPALIRTTFDLPEAQRSAIQNAFNKTVSAAIKFQFETAPDIISGIELTANGQKLAWNIADYLVSMGKSVEEVLEKQTTPEASIHANKKE